MANGKREAAIEEARKSLQRMQDFDVQVLGREGELGTLHFADAREPAQRLVDLFRLVALDALDAVPQTRVNAVKAQADAAFGQLQQILQFSLEHGNPKAQRDQFIAGLKAAYEPAFNELLFTIAFSLRRSSDFERLEREARATIQSLKDRIAELEADMAKRKTEADEVLAEIRVVAAEQGVSQQAFHFKQEAEAHNDLAVTWLKRTTWLTVGLGAYAVGTFFIHKVPWLAPTSPYETVQLAVSKGLVFVTIAFMLLFAARSYAAHRHNAVVNKHRQNGLVTYGALVKAASAGANGDIVLTKAAECIFSAQPTGFSKGDGGEPGPMSVVSVAAPLKLPGAG